MLDTEADLGEMKLVTLFSKQFSLHGSFSFSVPAMSLFTGHRPIPLSPSFTFGDTTIMPMRMISHAHDATNGMPFVTAKNLQVSCL